MILGTGMSKVYTLKTKKRQEISIYIRERKGKHHAPYVFAKQPDRAEVHVRIDTLESYDNTGFDPDNLKELVQFIKVFGCLFWEASKSGPATQITANFVRRVKEIATNSKLQMVMRMDDGEIRFVDFAKIIPMNSAFSVLKDPAIFQLAEADGSGVRWEAANIDVDVSELYDDSEPVDLKTLLKYA